MVSSIPASFHSAAIYSMDLQPGSDGRVLAAGCVDGALRVFDTRSKQLSINIKYLALKYLNANYLNLVQCFSHLIELVNCIRPCSHLLTGPIWP